MFNHNDTTIPLSEFMLLENDAFCERVNDL